MHRYPPVHRARVPRPGGTRARRAAGSKGPQRSPGFPKASRNVGHEEAAPYPFRAPVRADARITAQWADHHH